MNLVEYFWDERDQTGYFTYENDRTGELTQDEKRQPMQIPEATEELKASYFDNLCFWLRTQPLYD